MKYMFLILLPILSGCAAVSVPDPVKQRAASAAVTGIKAAADARRAAKARLRDERLKRSAEQICVADDTVLESLFGVRAAVSIRQMCDEADPVGSVRK